MMSVFKCLSKMGKTCKCDTVNFYFVSKGKKKKKKSSIAWLRQWEIVIKTKLNFAIVTFLKYIVDCGNCWFVSHTHTHSSKLSRTMTNTYKNSLARIILMLPKIELVSECLLFSFLYFFLFLPFDDIEYPV